MMRGKRHSYRVRLIAYDALPVSMRHRTLRLPSPSPTPLAFITASFPTLRPKPRYTPRFPHRIRLLSLTQTYPNPNL